MGGATGARATLAGAGCSIATMTGKTFMLHGPVRLSILAAVLAFGATGVALALAGLGVPFLVASTVSAAAAGFVQYAVLRGLPPPDRSAELTAVARLDAYRSYTATLRHDIRGVLSPALMMSDRLLNHGDKGVQRAGQVVVRSVERATALLGAHKDALADDPAPAIAPPVDPVPLPR